MLTRLQLELAACAVVFVLGSLSILGALEHEVGWAADGPQAGYFPFRLGIILVVVSLAIAAQALMMGERRRQLVLSRESARRMLGFFLPLVAYVGIAQVLGLYIATALYLAFVLRTMGSHPWRTSIAVALAVPAVSWVLFEVWFTVPLLKGPVEVWLGLA
ncbi:tripartite tricarboxylate transporter TctB family protein [Elioraea rosea]|uniref:tripartite tricarboxylate transporter TctB family protein n=1 Tax=Elioraea rosea TaxID=2492390 RepID=UPI001181EBA6|nr:tripartite tricarboxylate transporter TctB family protein [Elioraea rosea]